MEAKRYPAVTGDDIRAERDAATGRGMGPDGSDIISASPAALAGYKYVPGLVIVAFFMAAAPLVAFPFAVLGAIINYAYVAQFRHVALLGPCLVIWDARRKAHVPLSRVSRVSKTLSRNPAVLLLVLRDPCIFGRRVLFVPSAGRGDNSIAMRLQRLHRECANLGCPHDSAS